jgi:hypothetical protein
MSRIEDQTGMIKGIVTNTNGDSIVAGASIVSSPPTSSVTSNSSGEYTIKNVMPGTYTITATKGGYNPGNIVVNVSTGKVTTGDIRMNVIVNHAPNAPMLVSPSNGAVDQDRSLTISWTCSDIDGDNLFYDVYLDKSSSPTQKISENQTAVSYTVANLDSAATYYWKIVARDSKGAESSSIINEFRTNSGFSESWNSSNDYSSVNNPNGVWSYGRKWGSEETTFDLMTVKWGDSGWYLGNWGHGGPSIQSGPNMWAKDNSNGLPVVRWKCPTTGYYKLNGYFFGTDSRGVDVITFITKNDSIIFNNNVKSYQSKASFSNNNLYLKINDTLDFLIKWNGGVYSEYSWTIVNATIKKYK